MLELFFYLILAIDLAVIQLLQQGNCVRVIVQVNVKRIGGAYGAKLNRSASHAMACSIAAAKLKRPVRLVLDMATNMQVCTLVFSQVGYHVCRFSLIYN